MGIFICFMDICLGHIGIDFDKILYPDTGEDKEFVLNAEYRLGRKNRSLQVHQLSIVVLG